MTQNAFVAGALPRTPLRGWGAYSTPRPCSWIKGGKKGKGRGGKKGRERGNGGRGRKGNILAQ